MIDDTDVSSLMLSKVILHLLFLFYTFYLLLPFVFSVLTNTLMGPDIVHLRYILYNFSGLHCIGSVSGDGACVLVFTSGALAV